MFQLEIMNQNSDLDFDAFKRLALDSSLSRHEKNGFPDAYRDGKEEFIFRDICLKATNLNRSRITVLDIGPGCSHLPVMMAELCNQKRSHLMFVDSAEMLSHLPKGERITHYGGRFPAALAAQWQEIAGRVDVIVAYSVIQYIFRESCIFRFLDQCLLLLAEGGQLFLGDIPNWSMRKRFFMSRAGQECHKAFTGRSEKPDVQFNTIEMDKIDDTVALSLLSRARSAGFHAWILPQAAELPMATRREDILICRP
jgi:hypothetical protein